MKNKIKNNDFYRFIFGEFKKYKFFFLVTVVFFSFLNILTDLIIPTLLIKYTVLILCSEFNLIGIICKFILLLILFLIVNCVKYFVDRINKKYLKNIDSQTNKDILKFLISKGYNLNVKNKPSKILSSSSIRIFYRLLYQSIPLLFMYLFTLIYLAKIGKTLLIFNILFFLVIVYFEEKKRVFRKLMISRQFVETNNLVDKLILKYNENNREIPTEIDNIELFDKNDFARIKVENIEQLTLYEKLSKRLYSTLAKKINITFYTVSIIIYVYNNHRYIFNLNINLFLYIFLIYKTFSIIKIIINNDIINFKDINKINKTLANLEKNKTTIV